MAENSRKYENFTHSLISYVLILFFATIVVVASLLDIDRGISISSDAKLYHYPEVQHFLSHPIGFESSPGLSGPFPGYHWFQAALARLFGAETLEQARPIIRIAHFLIALIGAVAVTTLMSRLAHTRAVALALVSILLFDFYFLQAAYYFSTEAPAYTFLALLATLLANDEVRPSPVTGGQVGAIGLGLVFTRHPVLPALAGAVLYLMVERRWSALWRLSAYGLIAALVVLSYIAFWGGLASPYWRARFVSAGLYPHSLAHACAMAGIFAPFFLVALRSRVTAAIRERSFQIAAATVVIALISLWLWAGTNADPEAQRRFSVVWKLAALEPTILGNKSIVVLALMLIGAPLSALIIHEMVQTRRLFFEVTVFGGLLSAQILQNLAFQRYVELPILMGFAIFTARFVTNDRLGLTALYALAVSWGGLSISRFFGVI